MQTGSMVALRTEAYWGARRGKKFVKCAKPKIEEFSLCITKIGIEQIMNRVTSRGSVTIAIFLYTIMMWGEISVYLSQGHDGGCGVTVNIGACGALDSSSTLDSRPKEVPRQPSMIPQKIAVIGIGGSGKSVFARKLSEQTGLPVFHIDTLFWKGNWEAVSEAEYIEQQQKLLVGNEKWIIEGYVDEVLADRLKAADLIIYLDYSGLFCFWRAICRWFKHRKQSRPELPKESLGRLDKGFLWTVLTRGERPGIEKALVHVDSRKVIRLLSSRAASNLKLK